MHRQANASNNQWHFEHKTEIRQLPHRLLVAHHPRIDRRPLPHHILLRPLAPQLTEQSGKDIGRTEQQAEPGLPVSSGEHELHIVLIIRAGIAELDLDPDAVLLEVATQTQGVDHPLFLLPTATHQPVANAPVVIHLIELRDIIDGEQRALDLGHFGASCDFVVRDVVQQHFTDLERRRLEDRPQAEGERRNFLHFEQVPLDMGAEGCMQVMPQRFKTLVFVAELEVSRPVVQPPDLRRHRRKRVAEQGHRDLLPLSDGQITLRLRRNRDGDPVFEGRRADRMEEFQLIGQRSVPFFGNDCGNQAGEYYSPYGKLKTPPIGIIIC